MAALVFGISPDSALTRASNPDDWFWDSTSELLAVVAELLDQSNRQFHAANFKGAPPKPLEINRPGRGKRRAKGTTMAELQSMFPLTERPLKAEEG
jgi:hypothetical protein